MFQNFFGAFIKHWIVSKETHPMSQKYKAIFVWGHINRYKQTAKAFNLKNQAQKQLGCVLNGSLLAAVWSNGLVIESQRV